MNVISVVRSLQLTVILRGLKDLTLGRNPMNVIRVIRPFLAIVFIKCIKHTGEKTYYHNQCGKAFVHHCHFQRHKITHSREKPFDFIQCAKTFADHSNIYRHTKTHAGEKQYK